MRYLFWKFRLAVILILAVLCIGVFFFFGLRTSPALPIVPIDAPKNFEPIHEVIGTSVEGRDIDAYTYFPHSAGGETGGQGGGAETTHLLFVGGMHGGYEWNSVLLAYTFMDYVENHPAFIPEHSSVTVVPSLNPDGLYKVTGKEGRFALADVSTDTDTLASGRFNARKVDLNRNFDCKWKPESMWRLKKVSAGSAPFSEPEAEALKNFVAERHPSAVVFWHSKANAVFASECESGILPETLTLMNAYSLASGYPAVKSFDAYAITGDAEGWLASIGIPAITVELSTHETIEWERNLSGASALLASYRKGR